MRWKNPFAWVFVWAAFTASNTLAHDPYEITSTVSLLTNSLEVRMEMEFRTALRLAGMGDELPQQTEEELFRAWQPKLMNAGGVFFQITAGGNLISAEATNVTLGVESHIQFQLKYPRTDVRPLRFAAAGLKPLEGQGPYGTTLTVLDMVNKKVVGQAVLFPTSLAGDFDSTPKANDRPAPLIHVAARQLDTTNASAPPIATVSPAPKARGLWPILFVAGLICVALTVRRNARLVPRN